MMTYTTIVLVLVVSLEVVSTIIPDVPKNAWRLIWYKLKTTALTRSVFTLHESSYFNLNFGIKQSKNGWKCSEQWLPKAKILGPADE